MAASATLPADLPPPASRGLPELSPTQETVQRLVLTGFMGSGKTTVGRLLAGQLGWLFADLDAAIEARVGLTVPRIFALHGEAAFREAEVHELRELLGHRQRVIALGGGAPGTPGIRDLLRNATATVVVQLQAPFPVLYERCRRQAEEPAATDRPLLGDPEATARRYEERQIAYRSVAHWIAETADSSPATVAGDILRRLAAELPTKP